MSTFKLLTGLEAPKTRDAGISHPFPWNEGEDKNIKPGTGFDLPRTYFTETRGVTEENSKTAFAKGVLKSGYMKDRVKASFKQWQGRGTAAETKAKAKLAVVCQTTADGIRVYVIDAKDKPAAPAHLAKGKK